MIRLFSTIVHECTYKGTCFLTSIFFVFFLCFFLQVSTKDTKKKQKKKKNRKLKPHTETKENEESNHGKANAKSSERIADNQESQFSQPQQEATSKNVNVEPINNELVDGAVGGPIEPVLQYFDSIEQENRNLKMSQSFYEAIKRENEILKEKLKQNEKSMKETMILNEKLKETERSVVAELRLCKICMENEMEITFLPCGHLMSCVNCAPVLKNCPICRRPIKGSVRTYL